MVMQSRRGLAPIHGASGSFVSASLVPTALLDANGTLIEANVDFVELTGLAPGEALTNLAAAADQPVLLRHVLSALADNRAETELPLLSPNCPPRRLRLVFGPFPAPVPRVVLQVLDPRPERHSRDDLTRLRVAVDGAGQGIWDHDLSSGTAYFSPNWYRMRGFEPGEDIDAELGSWYERLHPEDRPGIEDITRRQNEGELTHNAFEYRERHRDGHYVWILSRGRPIAWNNDGTVARTLGTDTDITALKTAEQQLAAEKERLRVTLQAIADGMVATDISGRVTALNPAAERLSGWPAAEAIGRLVSAVLDIRAGDSPLDLGAMRSASRQTPIHFDGDTQLVAHGGTATEITLTVSEIAGPDGPQGYVFVFQDVTHSRALRRRLAHGATHDQLTDLPNRSYFEDALRAAGDEARRLGGNHALCYIDLDRFKAVNDGAGHAAGDEVLRRVAALLQASCRARDFAARVGGDEFVLILRDCSIDDARRIAEKLIGALAREDFSFEGHRFRVGASIGIAPITGSDNDPLDLTRRADLACYRSKDLGRGRVTLCGAA